jgi:hypothetical protein
MRIRNGHNMPGKYFRDAWNPRISQNDKNVHFILAG